MRLLEFLMKMVMGGLAVLCLGHAAYAKPLTADLSEYHVSIDSTFTGKHLILFGAQNDPGNVLVVIRGPERNITLRRKKQVMGLWVNDKTVTFPNIPYYYSMSNLHSSLKQGAAYEGLYEGLNIGFPTLRPSANDALTLTEKQDFQTAFVQLLQDKGLYRRFLEPVIYRGDTLFKSLIAFPDTLPRGNYSVELYLIEDGYLRGLQSLAVKVEKTGFDAFVFDLSKDQPVLYALLAIFIALSVGWTISQLFSRII